MGEDNIQTAKEIMIKVIQEQPDDSSFDEIIRELAFSNMIDRNKFFYSQSFDFSVIPNIRCSD